jgi:hypothetical protein
MEPSILNSTKQNLGVDPSNTAFDNEILTGINTAFSTLAHLGLRPGFRVDDDTKAWTDYLTDDHDIDSVKTYVQLRVKLLFDPPTMSYVLSSFERQLEELEWRLRDIVDGDNWTDPDPEEDDPDE